MQKHDGEVLILWHSVVVSFHGSFHVEHLSVWMMMPLVAISPHNLCTPGKGSHATTSMCRPNWRTESCLRLGMLAIVKHTASASVKSKSLQLATA